MSGLSKRQLLQRRAGIGASEIAVLAGLSRYSSPIAIYEAKLGIGEPIDSYAADLGIEVEAPIARVWAKREKRVIALVDTLQHPDKPFALATPDRAVFTSKEAAGDLRKLKQREDLALAEKLLQVKSTNWRMKHLWGEEGTDSIPDEYLLQAHWEGAVAGAQVVDFAVDFDKTKLFTYRVVVDLEVFEGLYEIAARFMIDHVARQVPPDPDATAAFSEYLKRAFPRETEAALDPIGEDESIIDAILLFAKLKTTSARMKQLEKLTKNQIAARIAGAAGISGSFGKITYKATKVGTKTDWKAVADEALRIASLVVQTMPEGDHRAALAADVRSLIEKNTKPSGGWRSMRCSWSDEVKRALGSITLKLDALTASLEVGEESSEEEAESEDAAAE